MKHLAPSLKRTLAAALLAMLVGPAVAADPVFPPGVRVGLTPLVGLALSKTFPGFETEDQGVKILITELPAKAFGEVETAFKTHPVPGGPKPESIDTAAGKAYYTIESGTNGTIKLKRYSLILSGGTFSGFVAAQIPENVSKIYTDDAIRQLFASATIRKEVPVEEQLGLLPFKVTDLASFKNVHTLAPGAAILLSDGGEEDPVDAAPFVVIGTVAAGPIAQEDRDRFAREAAGTIPGLRDGRITMSEPVRIDGTPGYETRIQATSGKATAVTVVQWLRFGATNSVMRIIGSAPRDQWESAFPRFRAVRDGIKPR